MLFTFGKYAGWPLHEIPGSYLALALETFSLPEALTIRCRGELLRRYTLTAIEPVPSGGEELRERIRRTYRELALKYHPDRGGNTEAMQALNDYYQRLNA